MKFDILFMSPFASCPTKEIIRAAHEILAFVSHVEYTNTHSPSDPVHFNAVCICNL
jgi:hypothetical protein